MKIQEWDGSSLVIKIRETSDEDSYPKIKLEFKITPENASDLIASFNERGGVSLVTEDESIEIMIMVEKDGVEKVTRK